MRILCILLFMGVLIHLSSAARGGDRARPRGGDRQRKFVDAKADPVFQALDALGDAQLRDRIVGAAEAYYSSRFDDAHTRIAAIMANHPESAIGHTLYDFLLLMDGAALGFSGETGSAIETLNRLQTRIESAGGDSDPDSVAGVMSLKIDIVQANGDNAAALNEMDALIARFGDNTPPAVHWRVDMTMQQKAMLLEQIGDRGRAAAAYRAFAERLQSGGVPNETAQQRLDLALRKLEELEQDVGSEEAAERGKEARP